MGLKGRLALVAAGVLVVVPDPQANRPTARGIIQIVSRFIALVMRPSELPCRESSESS